MLDPNLFTYINGGLTLGIPNTNGKALVGDFPIEVGVMKPECEGGRFVRGVLTRSNGEKFPRLAKVGANANASNIVVAIPAAHSVTKPREGPSEKFWASGRLTMVYSSNRGDGLCDLIASLGPQEWIAVCCSEQEGAPAIAIYNDAGELKTAPFGEFHALRAFWLYNNMSLVTPRAPAFTIRIDAAGRAEVTPGIELHPTSRKGWPTWALNLGAAIESPKTSWIPGLSEFFPNETAEPMRFGSCQVYMVETAAVLDVGFVDGPWQGNYVVHLASALPFFKIQGARIAGQIPMSAAGKENLLVCTAHCAVTMQLGNQGERSIVWRGSVPELI